MSESKEAGRVLVFPGCAERKRCGEADMRRLRTLAQQAEFLSEAEKLELFRDIQMCLEQSMARRSDLIERWPEPAAPRPRHFTVVRGGRASDH